ncbi:MAG: RNA 3'-terminal phosphate cyclase [Candidatus Methanoperedens sp.]|nr:RNA 3'-terminal phosphate cyclase [Candidatus Methanoperedens sp.]MCZ7369344.1 RNA 3'-terminal phosphate cyclase [Candidatus Methanoperedens sp.]
MQNNDASVKIDGSYGEGGGQILRTAVALSAVTGKPVEIDNIRKNRPKPGLAPQHVKAVKGAASICNAEVKGCDLHSTHLNFRPGRIKGGMYDIDIGTAGSISLLLQCLMPAACHAQGTIKLKITGGTDVSWSPSIDYLRFVTLFALSRMGYDCELELVRRGYYPRGGGCVEAVINPSVLGKMSFDRNTCEIVKGISHSSGLPGHVTERQAASAEKILQAEGYRTEILREVNNYPSIGSGITLWCGTIGAGALGERGLRAEKVGSSAASAMISELKAGAGVDIYLADQLVPFIALAGNGSFTTRLITPHTRTNIWVTEEFLDLKFKIEELETGLFKVSV